MAIPKHLFSIPAILFVPQVGQHHETYYHFRDSVTEQLLHMTHNTQIKNCLRPCSTIIALGCCTASVWRHAVPPDETKSPLYKDGYGPACVQWLTGYDSRIVISQVQKWNS